MNVNIDNALNEFVEKIPTINPNRNYWLVRTSGGDFYEDFITNNYVAIEPSNISYNTLKDAQHKAIGNPNQLSLLIKNQVKINAKENLSGRNISLKANQIVRFLSDIKDGDLVIIPSKNSRQLSIGEVVGNELASFSNEEVEKIECPYGLRRRVKWLKTVNRYRLDPKFFLLFTAHQTIAKVNDYRNIIERSVNEFYVLFENAHLIINVNTAQNIRAKDMFGFGHALLQELDDFCSYYELDFSSADIEVEINLNSPGKIDLKSKIKKATAVLGLIYSFIGGGYEDKEGHKIKIDGVFKVVTEAIIEYQNANQDRELRAKAFDIYADSLQIKNPEEFNKVMKQFSTNKDLPK